MKKIKYTNSYYIIVIIFLLSSSLYCQTEAVPPPNINDPDVGYETNPYQITSLANLRWLSENWWGWNINNIKIPYFMQTSDIDAFETINWNGGSGFKPIGRSMSDGWDDYSFWGTYNGNGHNISNLYINRVYEYDGSSWGVGLFGVLHKAYIYDLSLNNVTIIVTGSNYHIGLLAGYSGFATIKNCTVSGNILSEGFSPIAKNIGGLFGTISSSNVQYCSAFVNIEMVLDTGYQAGGIVGLVESSLLSDSFYIGNILNISDIFDASVGGIAGTVKFLNENVPQPSFVQNVYSVASIEGPGFSSGLAKTILHSSFINSFWNIETSDFEGAFGYADEYSIISGNYGLDTLAMKQAYNYIDNDWDFENVWTIDESQNNGYPFLLNVTSEHPLLPLIYEPINNSQNYQLEMVFQWEFTGGPVPSGYKLYLDIENPPSLLVSDQINLSYHVDLTFATRYYLKIVPYNEHGDTQNCPIISFSTIGWVSNFDLDIAPITDSLNANYPNPFNPSTTISFSLSKSSNLQIEIYNIKGQKVKSLINDYQQAGNHNIIWNGKDDNGHEVSSGIYLYKMEVGEYSAIRRMSLIK